MRSVSSVLRPANDDSASSSGGRTFLFRHRRDRAEKTEKSKKTKKSDQSGPQEGAQAATKKGTRWLKFRHQREDHKSASQQAAAPANEADQSAAVQSADANRAPSGRVKRKPPSGCFQRLWLRLRGKHRDDSQGSRAPSTVGRRQSLISVNTANGAGTDTTATASAVSGDETGQGAKEKSLSVTEGNGDSRSVSPVSVCVDGDYIAEGSVAGAISNIKDAGSVNLYSKDFGIYFSETDDSGDEELVGLTSYVPAGGTSRDDDSNRNNVRLGSQYFDEYAGPNISNWLGACTGALAEARDAVALRANPRLPAAEDKAKWLALLHAYNFVQNERGLNIPIVIPSQFLESSVDPAEPDIYDGLADHIPGPAIVQVPDEVDAPRGFEDQMLDLIDQDDILGVTRMVRQARQQGIILQDAGNSAAVSATTGQSAASGTEDDSDVEEGVPVDSDQAEQSTGSSADAALAALAGTLANNGLAPLSSGDESLDLAGEPVIVPTKATLLHTPTGGRDRDQVDGVRQVELPAHPQQPQAVRSATADLTPERRRQNQLYKGDNLKFIITNPETGLRTFFFESAAGDTGRLEESLVEATPIIANVNSSQLVMQLFFPSLEARDEFTLSHHGKPLTQADVRGFIENSEGGITTTPQTGNVVLELQFSDTTLTGVLTGWNHSRGQVVSMLKQDQMRAEIPGIYADMVDRIYGVYF